MKRVAGAIIEVLFCGLALALFCWFASSVIRIPEEPDDQLSESVEYIPEWGAPRSSHWYSVRQQFVEDHPRCEACGTTGNLNVHHVKPFHEHPELELEPSNLITLCREHHFRVGHDPDGPWKPKRPNWKASNPLVREHCEKIRQSAN